MADPLIRVSDLSVSFGRGDAEVRAVRNVSFVIARGETLALVGESGSGKSVSALSMLQLLPYPAAHHPTGSITLTNEEMSYPTEPSVARDGNTAASSSRTTFKSSQVSTCLAAFIRDPLSGGTSSARVTHGRAL